MQAGGWGFESPHLHQKRMSILLFLLVSIFPEMREKSSIHTIVPTYFSISYSSSGILTTDFQKLVFNKDGLSISLKFNSVKVLGMGKSGIYPQVALQYRKSLFSGLTLDIRGVFGVPFRNQTFKFKGGLW